LEGTASRFSISELLIYKNTEILPTTETTLANAATGVRAQQAELRKEMGTFDLAMAQIAYMITLEFFGAATKAGQSHAVLWLTAIALFFIPLAFVVTYLNNLMPLEGGLYEWARIAFGDRLGFLVAWNLWLYIILLVGEYGFVLITYIAFAAPRFAWMTSSNRMILVGSFVLVGAVVVISGLGLRVAKWVINAGGLMTVVSLGLLIGLATIRSLAGTLPSYRALPLVAPPRTLFSLSVFSKMTFGALCGFEFVAILAGECRNPVRTIGRSVLISAPVIAALYILGTSAILAFVPMNDINLVGPVPQALILGLGSMGVAKIVGPIAILLLFSNVFCTSCLTFSAAARLPMVAGWEGIVPPWFTRLHAKYRTPVNSTIFAAAITLAACLIALIGVNQEEAFSLIQIWAFTLYGIAYLAMFAIPLLVGKKLGVQPSLGLKIAASAGFVVTLLFVVLSIFPVIDVPNPAAYAWKTIVAVVGINLTGLILYARARIWRTLRAKP
jgi:glutamate:GABA antiporter